MPDRRSVPSNAAGPAIACPLDQIELHEYIASMKERIIISQESGRMSNFGIVGGVRASINDDAYLRCGIRVAHVSAA